MNDQSLRVENPITGTANECFLHFEQASKVLVNRVYPKRRLMADFIGASYHSVVRVWFSGGSMRTYPSGEYLLRLHFFLDLMGYKVHEVRNLSALVYNVAKLIAYQAGNLDELAKTLETSRSSLFSPLLGRGGVSSSRESAMQDFFARNKDALAEKTQFWNRKMGPMLTQQALKSVVSMGPPMQRVSSTLSTEQIIRSLAFLIDAAIPLAEYLESDACTDNDRELLRSLASHGKGVFRLSTRLNRLCGPRARREISVANTKDQFQQHTSSNEGK